MSPSLFQAPLSTQEIEDRSQHAKEQLPALVAEAKKLRRDLFVGFALFAPLTTVPAFAFPVISATQGHANAALAAVLWVLMCLLMALGLFAGAQATSEGKRSELVSAILTGSAFSFAVAILSTAVLFTAEEVVSSAVRWTLAAVFTVAAAGTAFTLKTARALVSVGLAAHKQDCLANESLPLAKEDASEILALCTAEPELDAYRQAVLQQGRRLTAHDARVMREHAAKLQQDQRQTDTALALEELHKPHALAAS